MVDPRIIKLAEKNQPAPDLHGALASYVAEFQFLKGGHKS